MKRTRDPPPKKRGGEGGRKSRRRNNNHKKKLLGIKGRLQNLRQLHGDVFHREKKRVKHNGLENKTFFSSKSVLHGLLLAESWPGTPPQEPLTLITKHRKQKPKANHPLAFPTPPPPPPIVPSLTLLLARYAFLCHPFSPLPLLLLSPYC